MSVKVRFALKENPFDGASIFISGSDSRLGNWDPLNAIEIHYNAPYWQTAPIYFNEGEILEFKFMKRPVNNFSYDHWEGHYANRRFRVSSSCLVLCCWGDPADQSEFNEVSDSSQLSRSLINFEQPQPRSETLFCFDNLSLTNISTHSEFRDELLKFIKAEVDCINMLRGNCIFHVMKCAEVLILLGAKESQMNVVSGPHDGDTHYALVVRHENYLTLFDPSLCRKVIRGLGQNVGGMGHCVWQANQLIDYKRATTWTMTGSFLYNKSRMINLAANSILQPKLNFYCILDNRKTLRVYATNATIEDTNRVVESTFKPGDNFPKPISDLTKPYFVSIQNTIKEIWKICRNLNIT